jgi:hypothetical protein
MDSFEPILAAIFEEAEQKTRILGREGVSVDALINLLMDGPETACDEQVLPGRSLDDYIEVQVHGTVDLALDIEALVIDPSFLGTPIGTILQGLAERHNFRLRTHPGFELAATDVPPDFRGPRIPPLAHRIATTWGTDGGRLNAALLGTAARSVVSDPGRWLDWGAPAETLQHIKQLWHVLVQFGVPVATMSPMR